jgi:glutathione S-transferase
MPLDVYLDPCTINSRKVLAGLDLVGMPFELHKIDYFTGGQKDPSYTKINPFATVPAAVDGDLTLTESNAILQYAADIKNSPAYPKDLKQRANVNRWLLWEASVWFQSCYVYLIQNVVQQLLGGQPDSKAIEAEAARWNKGAKILDDQLGKTKWLAGDEVTIADIAVAAPMHLWKASKMEVEKYPNLHRWMTEQVEKLPVWQKTQGAVESALLPGKK